MASLLLCSIFFYISTPSSSCFVCCFCVTHIMSNDDSRCFCNPFGFVSVLKYIHNKFSILSSSDHIRRKNKAMKEGSDDKKRIENWLSHLVSSHAHRHISVVAVAVILFFPLFHHKLQLTCHARMQNTLLFTSFFSH